MVRVTEIISTLPRIIQ